MTRPSPPPSAPWRSPRPAGMSSCTRWRTSPSASLPDPGRLSSGDRLPQSRPWQSLDGARRHERFGAGYPACRAPVPTSPGAMLSWARSLRAVPSGKKGSRLPRRWHHPASLMLASWGLVCCPSAKATCPRHSPARTGHGHLSGHGPPGLFPLDGCGLGRGVYPGGRITDAVPLLTQALEQTTAHGKRVVTRRSVVCPWGRRSCWLAVWRRRTPLPSVPWRLPARTRNAATRRMPCASSAILRRGAIPRRATQAEAHYRQALALAEELGMRPLQAHCHRGLGTLYATIGQQEQARAELSAAIVLYRAMDMTFWLPQTEAALAQVEGQ